MTALERAKSVMMLVSVISMTSASPGRSVLLEQFDDEVGEALFAAGSSS